LAASDRLRLYIFDCGYLQATAIPFVTADGAQEAVTATFANVCYLVQHPKGLLMWDAGLADSLIDLPDGLTIGAWRLVVTRTLASHLDALKISPASITYLGFSHMHPDHTGNANLFSHSTVLVGEKEYEAAYAPVPPPNYDTASYGSLRSRPTIKINDTTDVFGDGTAVIVPAPGHSVGHQVLFLDFANTGKVVLAGDLYYSSVDRQRQRVSAMNADIEQSFESIRKIEQLVAERGAVMIIHHDREQLSSLPAAPAYLG
jgi:glyoxylase-like metal-dependent hydrolase (beta-lactamase superfamily II)